VVACIDVVELAHQRIESPSVGLALRKLLKPFAKGGVEGAALRASDGTGAFDEVFVSA
jgi:hypothetical protein